MSRSGSFGVNYEKVFTNADEGLPAKVGDLGSGKYGDFVFVAGQAAEAAGTTGVSQIGVAQVAAADDQYLWVWIGGAQSGGTGSGIKGKIAASYVALAELYTTAAAGVADDTSAAGVKIVGCVALANTTGAEAVELKAVGHLATT
jgi:hypothetical protein